MGHSSQAPKSRVIAVIGMHRSGTSLATRALHALGVALGDNLAVEPAPDNAKGHWEDRDVIQLNKQVLSALALQWDLVGTNDEALMGAAGLTPLVERGQALLQAKTAKHPIWAFKDPRTARLWPFWRRVLLEENHFHISFVWVIRHPWAVAQSLARRDGFGSLKSHLLWLNHNLNPFEDITANQHVLLDYDRLLSQPRREITRIGEALALQPADGSAVDAFINDFLDTGLKHFDQPGAESLRTGAERVADQTYGALRNLAENETSLTDSAFLAEWRDIRQEAAMFAAISPLVDASSISESSRRELEGQLAQLAESSATALNSLRDQVREDGAAGLDGLQRQVAETLREQFDESSRRIGQVREDVAETLREQFDESGRRIAQVREDAAAGLDNLQRQVAETLREQFEVTGRRIDETREHLLRVEADMAVVIEQLDRERYTVFKPLLRRAYRLGAAVAMRLPGPVRRLLQRLKRLVLPRSVALRVTAGRPLPATDADAETVPDLGQPSAQRHDILVCPVIDWHFRFQRPQHLAKLLAERGHRVFYLSTRFGNAAVPGFRVLEQPAPNVFLVQLCIPGRQPVIYEDLLSDSTRERMVAAVGQLTAAGGLSNLVALVNLPFWRPLAEALPGALVVYDCMDHHAGFSSNSPAMLQEEERLLKSADLVITTSARLSGIVGQSAANVLIRNAAEIERFSTAPERLAYPSERPVAGYLGAIADWFDMDLVIAAAKRFQDWDFVLVGDTAFCDLSKAKKISNIKLIGEVPYADAANWVHSFDVALIPFQLTELTLCTSPVKVYEYLAAGKPVVATALPELQLMGDWVQVAENADQFTQHLGTAMMESDDRQRAAQRAEWVRQHDWKARVDQLEKAIETAFPKVSVIVLTYNNLSFTQACLHSLEANTHYPDWELVLVDNGSTDGTKDFLGGYAANNPRAKLVQNDENLGFAAGNNRGLEAADGEMLVILNNDTYVTPGWLLDLTRHLRRDPHLGLVGPVTNNIGNEAKIDIQYADMQEMQNAARAYTSSRAGERLDLPVIAFFCAAMPRTVYETVGGLEERFGLGFFEDDDYCQRVRKAGFQVAVAEDVFIHHHLSASFEQLDEDSRQALFERNKAIYEEKWGPWKPHRYRA